MATQPENRFLQKVNKKVIGYSIKMNVQFNNGIPDCYYSGVLGDLWVEYKWLPRLPVRDTSEVKIALSPLQSFWLSSRCLEGRNVAVIIGSPEGCVVLTDRQWEQPLLCKEFKERAVTATSVSEWINGLIGKKDGPPIGNKNEEAS